MCCLNCKEFTSTKTVRPVTRVITIVLAFFGCGFALPVIAMMVKTGVGAVIENGPTTILSFVSSLLFFVALSYTRRRASTLYEVCGLCRSREICRDESALAQREARLRVDSMREALNIPRDKAGIDESEGKVGKPRFGKRVCDQESSR